MPAQAWVTLVVGVFATLGVVFTIRQRTIADSRAQAWQRIAWCLERTTSDDDGEAELGWALYATVSRSTLITRTERDVIRSVGERVVRAALARTATTVDTGTDSNRTEESR